jgi:hypothetical protein
MTDQSEAEYTQRHVAYDLKKFRANRVHRQAGPIAPLRAFSARHAGHHRSVGPTRPARQANPGWVQTTTLPPKPPISIPTDQHYDSVRLALQPLRRPR